MTSSSEDASAKIASAAQPVGGKGKSSVASWFSLRRLAMFVGLLAGAVAIAYFVYRGPLVATVQPEQGAVVQSVVSSGRVLPPAEIKVAALLMSTALEVLVSEGDEVTAGQVVVTLDDADARAAVGRAQAALALAKAGRQELSTLSRPTHAAALRQAEASLAQAKRRYERDRDLYEQGVVPRVSMEEAETALAVSRAQRDAARLRSKAAGPGGSNRLVVAANIAQARAQLAAAKAQLQRAQVRAPAAGVVLERRIEPGDSAVAGSVLLVIARTGRTRLIIEPDERNLAMLRRGQEAVASADAYPRQRFDAKLNYIAPAVNPQRGTVEVHLEVSEPPPYLRPHMTVSVDVHVGKIDDALVLPRRAIRGLATDSAYVWSVVQGRAQRTPVKVGAVGRERVEILGGIERDARIVDDAAVALEDGDRVRLAGGE